MGAGSAYDTANGRCCRVRYRKPDKSHTDKRGFRTRRDADLFFASVEIAKHTGRCIDPGRARVRVADWTDTWLASSDLRPSTLKAGGSHVCGGPR
jgi:hypothetical protein